jgi:hypothetical protein
MPDQQNGFEFDVPEDMWKHIPTDQVYFKTPLHRLSWYIDKYGLSIPIRLAGLASLAVILYYKPKKK